jgi:uncharacterized protein DUF3365
MRANVIKSLIMMACILLSVTISFSSNGEERNEVREAARLLAVLFDSGRVAVAKNQDLLNDPTKGEKGFTPAVFEKQTVAIFEQRTGINLSDPNTNVPEIAKPLLARLLEESKKTIASYQPVINIPGLRYKGLIPATFGTETASRFQNWSGIYLRQIAPDWILRNPKNKADEYESAMLKALAEKASEVSEANPSAEVTDGGRTLRVMLPLYYGKACLDCHGQPKGERDMTGYPREGAKEGDLGGAISVKMPVK